MMYSQAEIQKILREQKSYLQDRFYVESIGYFGSYARNEQKDDSDIDLLVTFSRSVGWEFFELKSYIEDLLNMEVDLVVKHGDGSAVSS